MERARLVLPQIVNLNKDSDQGIIDITEMRRVLKIPHNKAYLVRKELLKDLHAEDSRLLKELRKTRAVLHLRRLHSKRGLASATLPMSLIRLRKALPKFPQTFYFYF